MSEPEAGVLTAPYVFEYTYRRSVGPLMGRFFTSLRDGRIEGARAPDGRVIVPPLEYDPASGEPLTDLVEVGPGGRVTTWTWVSEPVDAQPLDRPFAWALIELDGAATAMLHAVDAGAPERMSTGMRVRPRFRAEPTGGIRDIECFEPEARS